MRVNPKDHLLFLISLVKEINFGPVLQCYIFVRGFANKSYWPDDISKQKKYSKHITGSHSTRQSKCFRFVWFMFDDWFSFFFLIYLNKCLLFISLVNHLFCNTCKILPIAKGTLHKKWSFPLKISSVNVTKLHFLFSGTETTFHQSWNNLKDVDVGGD